MTMPIISTTFKKLNNEYAEAKKRPDVFYRQEFVDYNGCFYDKNNNKVTASNQIAKWMLEDNLLKKVNKIKMPDGLTYIIPTHTGDFITSNNRSNREEELFAKALWRKSNRNEPFIGSDIDEFIDYQVPIYRAQGHKDIGKIDLVAISHKSHKILLMELKRYSSEESLLRCVAEIYTYYMQIDLERLKNEIKEQKDDSILEYEVVPAVLVFKNQRQHKQYIGEYYNKVKELMKELNVSIYVIDAPNQYNLIHNDVEYMNKYNDEYVNQCLVTDVTLEHLETQKIKITN